MRRCLLLATALGFLAPVHAQSSSGGYPERSIHIVSPYQAGGGADNLARLVGQKMSETLGQMIVVENRPGADGNIGTEFVARAAPDGYTLLMGDITNLTLGPAVRRSVPYDPERDFVPIIQVVAAANIMAIHPSIPAANFREFVDYAKAHPGKLSFATTGTGGSSHLAGELLKRAAGIDMLHVPYKGAVAAMTDVLRGEVPVTFGLSQVLPQVREGKLRAIATTGARRTAILPDLPTIAEQGYPGFEATAWYGLLAPAGTPRPIVMRLHQVAAQALQAADVKQKLEAAGYQIIANSPEEFAAYMASEKVKWTGIVAAAGIKPE